MIKRKIEDNIRRFIDETPMREEKGIHKCLLIDGMRQIGKTYSIRRALGFMENDLSQPFATYPGEGFSATALYLDFHSRKEIRDIFSFSLQPKHLLQSLSLLPEFRSLDLRPRPDNRIILALDEIQDSEDGQGIDALKYLTYQPYLTVIASGSLVGVALKKAHSFPVGYLDSRRMYPLDFEEFMWAKGYKESFIDSLVDAACAFRPLPPSVHEELSILYREFLLVGGMPEVVSFYLGQSKFDPASIYAVARNLLSSLENDLGKYASPLIGRRARMVLESLPRAIAKERTRFFYSDVDKNAKARDYEASLDYLKDSGMVIHADNLTHCDIPLKAFERVDSEKLYVADNGLFFALSGLDFAYALTPGENHMGKGPIYENGAATVLSPLFDGLHYYSNAKGVEIDFVTSYENRVVLLEIKSSANKKSKSLPELRRQNPKAIAIRSGFRNIGYIDNLFSLPAYLLPFLHRILPSLLTLSDQ